MSKKIQWQPDMASALAMAEVEDRPILLDFFNPG
jgi:uncharacterized protein YyaL (SSP411 family)